MKAKPTQHPGEVVLELDRRDESMMALASLGRETSPFRLKNILVPIDFSDCSKKALRYALPMAKQHGAAITLLYTVHPDYTGGELGAIDYGSLTTQMLAEGEKELAKLVVDEVRGAVPADTLVRSGYAAAEIIETARGLPADLIVISTHGRTGLKHVLIGSVTEQVVRRAPCPVLVVREQEHEFLS